MIDKMAIIICVNIELNQERASSQRNQRTGAILHVTSFFHSFIVKRKQQTCRPYARLQESSGK